MLRMSSLGYSQLWNHSPCLGAASTIPLSNGRVNHTPRMCLPKLQLRKRANDYTGISSTADISYLLKESTNTSACGLRTRGLVQSGSSGCCLGKMMSCGSTLGTTQVGAALSIFTTCILISMPRSVIIVPTEKRNFPVRELTQSEETIQISTGEHSFVP